jgi:small subunit ribosomal protein S11
MVQKAKKSILKKDKKIVPLGIVNIQSTFNNTIVTICDPNGDALSWASSGSTGFKGTRKRTAYAGQIAAEKAISNGLMYGFKKVRIFVKGQGTGRETAIRLIQGTVGLEVVSIKDITTIPHNGCRPPKRRRI